RRIPCHLQSAWGEVFIVAGVIKIAIGQDSNRGTAVRKDQRWLDARRGYPLKVFGLRARETALRIQTEPMSACLLVDVGQSAFRINLPQAATTKVHITFSIHSDAGPGMRRRGKRCQAELRYNHQRQEHKAFHTVSMACFKRSSVKKPQIFCKRSVR